MIPRPATNGCLTNLIFDIIIKNDNESGVLAMGKSFIEVIMNPARQRIAQYLMLNGRGTVNEIAAELADIPRPSLYRHINLMLEAGCLQVVSERPVRGAVERTYGLVQNPMGKDPGVEEVAAMVQGMLGSLAAQFAAYLSGGDVDFQRDMLTLSTSTLLLSDGEMMEFYTRIGEVINDYVKNKPGNGRKPRSISLISAPVNPGKGE